MVQQLHLLHRMEIYVSSHLNCQMTIYFSLFSLCRCVLAWAVDVGVIGRLTAMLVVSSFVLYGVDALGVEWVVVISQFAGWEWESIKRESTYVLIVINLEEFGFTCGVSEAFLLVHDDVRCDSCQQTSIDSILWRGTSEHCHQRRLRTAKGTFPCAPERHYAGNKSWALTTTQWNDRLPRGEFIFVLHFSI